MTWMTTTRTIGAPLPKVFETVSDIRNFSKAVPHIVDVEFLSEKESGVGARFKETRIMNGRKASTELEVTEFVENDRVRMVSDAGGTIWDTVFTVESAGADGPTELHMAMDARPHRLLARLVTPLIKGTVQKAVAKDMDAIKDYCEQ